MNRGLRGGMGSRKIRGNMQKLVLRIECIRKVYGFVVYLGFICVVLVYCFVFLHHSLRVECA